MKQMHFPGDAIEHVSGVGTHYHNLMRHIERIDLMLQKYYHRHGLNSALDDFLLPEETVEACLAHPRGAPDWATRSAIPDSAGQRVPSTRPEEDAFCELIDRFDLTDFEGDVLLLGLLPYFDSRYYALFSALSGDKQKKLPTFELALSLFCDSATDKNGHLISFLPQSPLLENQLLEIREKGAAAAESWSQIPFITANEVFHYLLGNEYMTSELRACTDSLPLPEKNEEEGSFAPFSIALREMLFSPRGPIQPVIMLRGKEGSGRAVAVTRIAETAGRAIMEFDVRHLPEDDDKAEDVLSQSFRFVRMRSACMVIRNICELAESRVVLLPRLSRLLGRPGLTVVCLIEPYRPLVWLENIPQVILDMPVRSAAERAAILGEWLEPFGRSDFDVGALARCFNFTPEALPSIIQEAALYSQLRGPGHSMNQQDIRKALRLRSQKNFGKLAQRVEPKRHMDDLIVSDELRQQLKEITMAFKYRENILDKGFADKVVYGTGISALFYGPSGTGKTMAAEVLAAHQGVDLIKIDLSTIVNKYVGETEKNLARVFDLAEADSGVLFFDEADALFGKRSETKDAQDRHANIEVSYLLQRLENYPGLVILATNNRSHLDDAFSRRFTFITRFAFPDVALREKMWQAIWPREIQLDKNIDFHALARRVNITGANIRNVALLSAWLAADEPSGVVNAATIDLALKRELAKVGRLIF